MASPRLLSLLLLLETRRHWTAALLAEERVHEDVVVGVAERVQERAQPLFADFSQATHRQAGARKRMPPGGRSPGTGRRSCWPA